MAKENCPKDEHISDVFKRSPCKINEKQVENRCCNHEPKHMSMKNRSAFQLQRDLDRQARMEVDAAILSVLDESRASKSPLSYQEVALKFGVDHKRVSRLDNSQAKLDGTGRGRPTLLSAAAENHLLCVVRDKINDGEDVKGSTFSRLAKDIWIAENKDNAAEVPEFGYEFRRILESKTSQLER